jgi:hypothetical protein
MSFFRRWHIGFGGGEAEQLKVLEQGIELLRLSTVNCLRKRYASEVGPEMADALAVAVVSVMTLEPPCDEGSKAFYEQHRSEIGNRVQEAHGLEDISGPSGCASYLFAAEILHSAMVRACCPSDATRGWKSTRDLEEQAANLGIYLPSPQEICGSEDRGKCIDGILSFAKAFYYTNTWIGISPARIEVPVPSIPHDYGFLSRTLLDAKPALPALPVPSHHELPSLYQVKLIT